MREREKERERERDREREREREHQSPWSITNAETSVCQCSAIMSRVLRFEPSEMDILTLLVIGIRTKLRDPFRIGIGIKIA
jgi:hypothetical protein